MELKLVPLKGQLVLIKWDNCSIEAICLYDNSLGPACLLLENVSHDSNSF